MMTETAPILAALLAGARTVLGDRFVGMYLYGSLASGDFNAETSDIDFIIVTDGEVPPELVPELEALHMRLWASGDPWAMKLEGGYIPKQSLCRVDLNAPPTPHVNEGRFYLDPPSANDVFQRYILRNYALTISGPPLEPLIDPVSDDDLREAVRDNLRGWWLPMLDNPFRMASPEYQAFAVLTMCRTLYTLREGGIASKPVAASWAQQTLGEPWADLIAESLAWRRDAMLWRLDEVLDFLRFVAAEAGLMNESSRGA
jgi:hypothetical protein